MLQEPWPEDDSEDRWLSQVRDNLDDVFDNNDQVCYCDN